MGTEISYEKEPCLQQSAEETKIRKSHDKTETEEEKQLCKEFEGGRKPKEDHYSSRKIIFVLTGSVVLCFCLLSLNITTFYYLITESRERRGDTTLCLNCSYLRLHPDDDLDRFSVYEPNTCCLKEDGNYSEIVDKVRYSVLI